MEYSIEVENLTRRFGKFIAVDAISFKVKKGEVFGFLGANGAGKSTTIRMLCAILKSTSGTAKVAGYDINREPEKVKRHIGYMSQRFSLYDDLTVIENLRFFGGIYGIEGNRLEQRIEWALNMADLGGKEEMISRSLPVGWKQRLSLGCAALHEPDIIFLDEPTGGVDPLARRIFWAVKSITGKTRKPFLCLTCSALPRKERPSITVRSVPVSRTGLRGTVLKTGKQSLRICAPC